MIVYYPLPDSDFYNRMRAGHLIRTGHELNACLKDEGGIFQLVRKCCEVTS